MEKILYSLTNPQKSIWFTEEFYKGTPIENITGSVIIPEKVNFSLLEQAINIFVEKNDSFRLKFMIEGQEVKQFVDSILNSLLKLLMFLLMKIYKKLNKKLLQLCLMF